MKILGKLLSYLAIGVAVVFFLFAVLMPTVLSGRLAIVRSSSMEPTMPAGALAVMVPVDPNTVKVGDIITFKPPWDPDVVVSHRVIGIKGEGKKLYFDTKGDAVEESDPYYIPAQNTQGRVVFNIPEVGFLMSAALPYVRTRWGFLGLVVLPSLALFGSTIRNASRASNPRYRRTQLLLKRRRMRR